MLTDKAMRKRMRGWSSGLRDGTVCGVGSTMANTAVIRGWLPKMVVKYKIKSVCDAGAGDLHWIRHVDWNVKYKPYDLIPRRDEVTKIDITRKTMKKSDAILCRMVLNHLDQERVEMALENFRQTAKYLFATHFEEGPKTNFMWLDLPALLGEPLEMARDGNHDNGRLALWKL